MCSTFTGVCFQCANGFTLNTVLNMCFNCSVSNCDTCSANNVCSSCADTFALQSNGSCGCPSGASLQNNGTVCGCPVNQTYDSDPEGGNPGCRQNCGITDCIGCSTNAEGVATCSVCVFGYVVLNNGSTCS